VEYGNWADSTGLAVSGIDDAVISTAREEVFYLSDTGNLEDPVVRQSDAKSFCFGLIIARYGGALLECEGCASHKVECFKAEVAIHFSGREGLTKPLVWVFPRLEVCPFCGSTNFTVPEEQLSLLRNGLALPDARARNPLRN